MRTNFFIFFLNFFVEFLFVIFEKIFCYFGVNMKLLCYRISLLLLIERKAEKDFLFILRSIIMFLVFIDSKLHKKGCLVVFDFFNYV